MRSRCAGARLATRGFSSVIAIAAAAWLSAATRAEPPRLGIDVQYEDYAGAYAIAVNEVFKDSLADRAGIVRGDVIVAINGQPITSPDTLGMLVRSGAQFSLKINNRATGRVRTVSPMALRAIAPAPAAGGAAQFPRVFRITNDASGAQLALASDQRGRISLEPVGPGAGQRWRLDPQGPGRFRLVNEAVDFEWSLTATASGGRLSMEREDPITPQQIWTLAQVGRSVRIVQSYREGDVAIGIAPTLQYPPEPQLGPLTASKNQRWNFNPVDGAGAPSLVGTWDEYRTANGRPNGVQIIVQPDFRFAQFSEGMQIDQGKVAVSGDRVTLSHADGSTETFRFAVNAGRADFYGPAGPEVFFWRPVGGAVPQAPAPPPRERRISRRVVPNDPLAPAKVTFKNSFDDALWVYVVDLRDKTRSMQLEIPAGTSQTVDLERDAGATIYDKWEVPLQNGDVHIDERSISVPPQQFYRVSVYSYEVMSVVIDATQRGRGKMSNVHRSPKSLGAFPIPPGAGQQDGVIDAYTVARRAKNPGAVDRIDPADWVEEGRLPDPFKQQLERGR